MNCCDGFLLGTRVMVDTPPTQGCSKPVMLLSSNSGSLPQRSGRYREFGSLADIFVQDSHWPERGYGAHLDLRIYVYLPDEIEGLMELVSGRDRSIRSSTCVKGQWGTQVIKSRFFGPSLSLHSMHTLSTYTEAYLEMHCIVQLNFSS